ncbi:MAG: 5,6-dimethylbenzimidazole synthase [Pseudomonadota bacterium]|nr:5,6-dimethylbenzimidazole synthase [Pseudomonadota bacterium]MDE3038386.1 5,6-dimethylbenzimidazole synthase [Pseudomonadota bacterium]
MTSPHAFSEAERSAVYRAIRERRDIRRFRPGHIPDDIVLRLLRAAAHAPSVGYMQPWNFLVIRDMEVRRNIHQAFLAANEEAQTMFPPERRDTYAALKLEGILDSGLNLCITCDRSRFGPVVLGRTCQPDMDLYSTVCAVQNLWLAARAEGVGVGWVSILRLEDLQRILGLPENVVPIAYLCVGYTDVFAAEPELKTSGWLPEIPLAEMIFYDRWGQSRKSLTVL